MSKRVKGIVVEIGGNTAKLDKALAGTNKQLGSTQASLKDVERLLKLDPKNTKLLEQKQRLLATAVSETEKKLETLNQANEQAAKSAKNYDAWKAAYDPIQAEITTTYDKLKDLRKAQKEMEDLGEVDSDAYRKLTDEIQTASKELKDLRQKAKDVNEEFGNPISQEQYDALQREIIETEQKLKKLSGEFKDFGSVASQQIAHVGEELKEAGEKLSGVGEKLSDAGGGALKATGVITAGGTAAVVAADNLQSATNSYLSFTGTAAKGMEILSDGTVVATDNAEKFKEIIDAIYENNYGEGFEDIAQAMAIVKTNISDIDDSQLQGVTESALTLRDAFEFDVNESVRTAKMLMDQYGLSADEAFNLIAQGAQKGLNKNGDLLDTINEYSVHYKQLGLSAEEMLNSLANGSKAGTFSVDKLGDAIKEFGIRVKDGSDSTKEAFEYLGYDADKLTKTLYEGGEKAANITSVLISELADMPDSVEKTTAGVALFGTMWEDLGAEGIKALSELEGEINLTNSALDEIKKQKYDDLKNQISQLGRAFTSDVAMPIGEILIPIVSKVIDALSVCVDVFGALSPAGQTAVVIFGAIVAAIGPVLIAVGNIVSTFGKAEIAIGKVMIALPKLQAMFSSVFGFIAANPVVLLIAAIVGLVALIAANWEKVKQLLSGVISFISGTFSEGWKRAWNGVISVFSGIFSSIKSVAKGPINAVISMVNKAIGGVNFVGSALSKLPGVNIGAIGKIPMLADGGTVYSGNAIVGEAGPELLTVTGGRAVVRPLANTQNHSGAVQHNHTGTIRVEGVNTRGEMVGVMDMLIDELRQEVRR